MENLMKMYRSVRVNDFFKKYTHAQIDIAHRIMEYLEPDKYFPPENLKDDVMNAFMKNDVPRAVSLICEELGIDTSDSYRDLETEAAEFARDVLKDFLARKNKDMIEERERLLKRLEEINKELGMSD